MILTKCCDKANHNPLHCSAKKEESCSVPEPQNGCANICYIVRVPAEYLTSIIDINWTGETGKNLVLNDSRPNKTSFILGTDALPIGYKYDSGDNILYFPPNTPIKSTQFAVWQNEGTDSCGANVWSATPLCVTVQAVECSQLS